jgi:hypothetical protein
MIHMVRHIILPTLVLAFMFSIMLQANMLNARVTEGIESRSGLEGARAYLVEVFNPTLKLCMEAPNVAPNVYWLVGDNLWAYKALEDSYPDISQAIRAKLEELAVMYNLPRNLEGLPMSYKHEAVIGETIPLPFNATISYTLHSNAYAIKTEIANSSTVLKDWQEYADLLLYASLSYYNEGKNQVALFLFDKAKNMWDGKGIWDNATQADGMYTTYKLALLLYTSKILGVKLNFEAEIVNRIWRQQNQDTGGIISHYFYDGTPHGDTNTETTAIVVIAKPSIDTDGDGTPDDIDNDDDNDGIPDFWEVENGFDPLNADDATLDSDSDGLTNLEEYQRSSNPNLPENLPQISSAKLHAVSAIVNTTVNLDIAVKNPLKEGANITLKFIANKAALYPTDTFVAFLPAPSPYSSYSSKAFSFIVKPTSVGELPIEIQLWWNEVKVDTKLLELKVYDIIDPNLWSFYFRSLLAFLITTYTFIIVQLLRPEIKFQITTKSGEAVELRKWLVLGIFSPIYWIFGFLILSSIETYYGLIPYLLPAIGRIESVLAFGIVASALCWTFVFSGHYHLSIRISYILLMLLFFSLIWDWILFPMPYLGMLEPILKVLLATLIGELLRFILKRKRKERSPRI